MEDKKKVWKSKKDLKIKKQFKVKKKTKKIIKEKAFRIYSKKLFLTYPQCDISLEDTFNQLKMKLSTFIVSEYLLVHENHNDLSVNIGKHIHVFIECKKKFQTTDEKFFDLVNTEGKVFHGNYQGCKKKNSTLEYLLKDVLDINQTLVSKELRYKITQDGLMMGYHEALIELAEQGKIKEAMQLLKKEDPKGYVKSYDSIQQSLQSIFLEKVGIKKRFKLEDFVIPKEILENIEKNIQNKALYIKGESGTGKTQMIKTLLIEHFNKNPLIINNFDSLREYKKNTHDAIVFDDCSLAELNREQLIKLLDLEESVTLKARYSNIRLEENLTRIFISNRDLENIISYTVRLPDLAIDRRVEIIEIKDSLIKVKEKIKENQTVSG
jgi:hypothetical protein